MHGGKQNEASDANLQAGKMKANCFIKEYLCLDNSWVREIQIAGKAFGRQIPAPKGTGCLAELLRLVKEKSLICDSNEE